MSRQNPPQIKVSHLSPDPPVALSSHSQQAGGAAGWWRVSRHVWVPKTDRATGGVSQLQSHQSRYSVQLESPQMWVWPQLPFGGHPPPPRQLEDLLSSQSPSSPTLPLFPHPPGSFCNAPGWATWAGVEEAAHGGGRGGSSKRHLGPDPHLGAFEQLSWGMAKP